MSNVATERRDTTLRRSQEDGAIRTWADDFGVWHAAVLKTYTHPVRVARGILRLELQDRAPRDTYVDPPVVKHTPEDDTATHYTYKEQS